MSKRNRLIAGAFVAAAVAVPLSAAVIPFDNAQVNAAPCLAWMGNKDDGQCISYSNGQPVNVGTPNMGIYGPNSGALPGGGIGITTGSLLPSQTWTTPIG
jgi:hypothetical protein